MNRRVSLIIGVHVLLANNYLEAKRIILFYSICNEKDICNVLGIEPIQSIKTMKKITLFIIVTLIGIGALMAQSLSSKIDALMLEKFPPDKPGATILVAKKGKVLYRNAFGMANLELQVPMKPENVFEIGSITKQFTSVSILMLKEEGKLSLDDKLSKFIQDYPKGDEITVHQLLNHTSGIRSYTGMEEFRSKARTDLEPMELINVFKDEPMDFEPGSEYEYNNSAYIILGYIIEQLSGMTYEDYIEKNIFQKLGMTNSFYGSKSEMIPNRASGYQPNENGYNNAEYLSMTLPYAGGSLMSTVDDMLKWEQSIHNNTLISKDSKNLAFTNTTTNDGKPIYYGYGFSIDEINGMPTIEHGGGIFGYTCYGVYAPSEDLYAIVLTNSNGNSPTDITVEIAALALGKPFPKQQATNISEGDMKKWVGTYEFEDGVVRFVTFKDGTLYSQREGSENLKLYAVSKSEFYFEDSFTNYSFETKNGQPVANFRSRIRKSTGVKSDRKPPAAKESITLDASAIKVYEGTYELQPGFDIVISAKGSQLFAQATGQPEFEVFGEAEDKFFLKVVAADIVFNRDEKGNIKSLTLNQGGQQMEGMKK